jgi:hypothetical protein
MPEFEGKIATPSPAPKPTSKVQPVLTPEQKTAENIKVNTFLEQYKKQHTSTATQTSNTSSKAGGVNNYAPAPITTAVPTVAEKDEAQPEKKEGLKFINPKLTEKAFAKKQSKAAHLAKTSATTKPAEQKINESELAQDTPAEEGQSTANDSQVSSFANQTVPDKTKAEGQQALKNAIEQVIPKTIGDIQDFKKNKKGSHISAAVGTQVKGDVGSVKQSFGGVGKTPTPAPTPKGSALPEAEAATPVEQINMGTGVLPAIEPAHLDTKDYLKQNDALLKQEELPQEHLDMVDTGDLAEANKQRAQLKVDAVAEPLALKEASAAEHKQLNSDMHAEEKQARSHMGKHRSGKLKDTGDKQKETKTKLEKEREATAKTINDKYTTCQTSIINKLDALEKDALARFDQGQAKATTDFEDQVNKDIEAFKEKRYDTDILTRGYRKTRDFFLGIDDFPEVGKAFADARKTFETAIDRLIGDITADNNKVIAECKKELAECKKDIALFVSKLKGSLKDVGQLAMKDVNEKLKQLDAEIDKRKEKIQQQLADKRQAAMKAIDAKIEKMKEKLSGALSIIGKLLLEALKKFFKWALEKLGIDAEGFFNTLAKMGAAIKAMFKSPGKFFSNLIAAIKGSINDFRANFKTYIIAALADWLTGAMGSTGIEIPKEFSVRAVIGMLLQVLGLSWAFLRSKLVALIGEQKVAWAEKTVDVVKKFVTGGVAALWDWIKDQASSIKDMFIQGTKDWLLTTLVTKFVEWVASLLIPGGAIIRLIQGIYNLVMWFVNNIQKILRWVNAVLDSLGSIAMGAIGAAIGFIVNGMKIIIPVILDFFARLLNISGIVDAVKKIIDKIAGPIQAAINKVIDWIVGWVKKMFGKGETKGDKKPLEDDKRTPEQKQKDLDKGIKQATTYLQTSGKKNRKDIDEYLEKYRRENGLVELNIKIVKHKENGKDLVHLHGEVNPKEDKEFEAELEEGGEGLFKDLKLGSIIGQGGNKIVYDISNHSDKVIAVLKKGKPISAIKEEIELLNEIASKKLPIVQVLQEGNFEGQPSLILKKYKLGSKEVVKLESGKIKKVGTSKYLNEKSISDLNYIKRTMLSLKVKVDDLQFLIGEDGTVVIADPLDVFNEKPSTKNLRMIDLLIDEAKNNIK